MRFLLDQDAYALTAQFLRDLGHDVVRAAEIGQSRATDSQILEIAYAQSRILVTRDKDFGGLVFVNELGAGIIYLRILPSNLHAVHEELERVLKSYSEDEIRKAFIVVEPGRHRFRTLPA